MPTTILRRSGAKCSMRRFFLTVSIWSILNPTSFLTETAGASSVETTFFPEPFFNRRWTIKASGANVYALWTRDVSDFPWVSELRVAISNDSGQTFAMPKTVARNERGWMLFSENDILA